MLAQSNEQDQPVIEPSAPTTLIPGSTLTLTCSGPKAVFWDLLPRYKVSIRKFLICVNYLIRWQNNSSIYFQLILSSSYRIVKLDEIIQTYLNPEWLDEDWSNSSRTLRYVKTHVHIYMFWNFIIYDCTEFILGNLLTPLVPVARIIRYLRKWYPFCHTSCRVSYFCGSFQSVTSGNTVQHSTWLPIFCYVRISIFTQISINVQNLKTYVFLTISYNYILSSMYKKQISTSRFLPISITDF